MPLNNGLPPKPTATVKKPEQIAPQDNQSMAEKIHDVQHMLEQIANYHGLGKSLKRERMMQEVALEISQIAEIAEQVVVNEGEDWYDKHTLSRNMKEVKTYAKDFVKLASEADMLHQRMSALYEDMGRILERYFEIPNDEQAPEQEPDQAADVSPAKAPAPQKMEESEAPKSGKPDELTIRAIKAVHENLKKKNPEFAKRFAKLPPKKMKEAVWKLVR
jgi:DNA-directed RNA polymerase subunit F